ncbi:hypothetical protein [Nocardioides astragali]|uniref:Uncharacterized protein n=1 Tax=Nocardioides astragali TaxID=1776736 RepID=A0ABW2NEB7_9ACTN|nr:hypothetical protein [Nocardioides astragali]
MTKLPAAGIEHRLTGAVSYFDAAARLGRDDLEVSALLRVVSGDRHLA